MNLETFKKCGTAHILYNSEPLATGFFIRYEKSSIWLVTARHVVRHIFDQEEPHVFVARFKGEDGDEHNLEIDLDQNTLGAKPDLFFSSDTPTDIAVVKVAKLENSTISWNAMASSSPACLERLPFFEHTDLISKANIDTSLDFHGNGFPSPPLVSEHDVFKPYFRSGNFDKFKDKTHEWSGVISNWILSSVPIGPGDSGGPLVVEDESGDIKVVGVLTNQPHETLENTLAWPTDYVFEFLKKS